METSSLESPPQKNENSRVNAKYIPEGDGPVPLVDVVPLIELPPQTPEERQIQKEIFKELKDSVYPAEDIELTALKKYIQEDGFVLATVAFHIVSLCAQPMTTPSTTTWAFQDRAMIPDMVLALLNQPGYLDSIWPSLKIVMGSNKGNAAWTAGIATTIAFFHTINMLPALKELKQQNVD